MDWRGCWCSGRVVVINIINKKCLCNAILLYVWLVLNASGTKVSIDGLVEKEKKHLLEIDK